METTYEGTKKVKDTKLQMLTTRLEELKMSEDKLFDSFYGKLNELVIGKFNVGEKEGGLQGCEEDFTIIAGELPCQGHCN